MSRPYMRKVLKYRVLLLTFLIPFESIYSQSNRVPEHLVIIANLKTLQTAEQAESFYAEPNGNFSEICNFLVLSADPAELSGLQNNMLELIFGAASEMQLRALLNKIPDDETGNQLRQRFMTLAASGTRLRIEKLTKEMHQAVDQSIVLDQRRVESLSNWLGRSMFIIDISPETLKHYYIQYVRILVHARFVPSLSLRQRFVEQTALAMMKGIVSKGYQVEYAEDYSVIGHALLISVAKIFGNDSPFMKELLKSVQLTPQDWKQLNASSKSAWLQFSKLEDDKPKTSKSKAKPPSSPPENSVEEGISAEYAQQLQGLIDREPDPLSVYKQDIRRIPGKEKQQISMSVSFADEGQNRLRLNLPSAIYDRLRAMSRSRNIEIKEYTIEAMIGPGLFVELSSVNSPVQRQTFFVELDEEIPLNALGTKVNSETHEPYEATISLRSSLFFSPEKFHLTIHSVLDLPMIEGRKVTWRDLLISKLGGPSAASEMWRQIFHSQAGALSKGCSGIMATIK